MEAQIAYTIDPTMDTEFNRVAKTVVPGGRLSSTRSGSTGETVLNETAFDVSEIFETVNPVGHEARQIRARIGGMTCDELVNLLESNEADGGFLESVLSGGVTGAEFERMWASAGTAHVQEADQQFSGITGIDSFKIMTLWSRTRAEPTDRQASGEEPSLPRHGPRPDRNNHAESNGREEDEQEGRSEGSEEYILKSFGAHRGPKLELTQERCDDYKAWVAVKNAARDWLMGHATELATAVGSVIADPNNANQEVTIAGLSRKAGLQDRDLGGHLYATVSQYVKLKLVMDSSRYRPNGPSAIKIYHYLAYKLHRSTQKTRTKLTEAMGDASSAGRWQPVKKPGQLEAEVKALDQAADDIRIMTGDQQGQGFGDQHSTG